MDSKRGEEEMKLTWFHEGRLAAQPGPCSWGPWKAPRNWWNVWCSVFVSCLSYPSFFPFFCFDAPHQHLHTYTLPQKFTHLQTSFFFLQRQTHTHTRTRTDTHTYISSLSVMPEMESCIEKTLWKRWLYTSAISICVGGCRGVNVDYQTKWHSTFNFLSILEVNLKF